MHRNDTAVYGDKVVNGVTSAETVRGFVQEPLTELSWTDQYVTMINGGTGASFCWDDAA